MVPPRRPTTAPLAAPPLPPRTAPTPAPAAVEPPMMTALFFHERVCGAATDRTDVRRTLVRATGAAGSRYTTRSCTAGRAAGTMAGANCCETGTAEAYPGIAAAVVAGSRPTHWTCAWPVL